MKRLILALSIIVFLAPSPLTALTSNSHATDLERGSNQFWSITDASQTGLDFTSDFTLSIWVKFESFPGNDEQRQVIGRRQGGNGYSLFIRRSAGGTLLFRTSVNNGTLEVKDFSTSVTTGVWYHFVYRFTASTNEHSLWTNAVEATPQTGTVDPGNSTNDFSIGGDALDSNNANDGLHDDARAWSRALSDAEIGDLYATPCTFDNGASIQGWWVFDNDAGVDQTSNNNDLTNNNSATFSTDAAYSCAVAAPANRTQGIIMISED